jgi:peptidoglycan hydrolase-like protein with peptidoglycan-binding domain
MARTKKPRPMNTSTLAGLPAFASNSVLNGLGRFLRWSLARFFSAPLQNTALGMLGVAIVVSTSNALFWQTAVHPAPLFAQQTTAPASPHTDKTAPIAPLPRVLEARPTGQPLAEQASAPAQNPAQSPSITPAPTQSPAELPHEPGNVSNEQLARAQEVLKTLGLFEGKVDGFYGPQTAQGIRAFELRNGLAPKGALTPQIIQKIINSPVTLQPSAQTVSVRQIPQALAQSQPDTPQANSEDLGNVPMPAPLQTQSIPDPLSAITQSVAARQNVPTSLSPAQTAPVAEAAAIAPVVDAELVRKIQRGLASLGFLAGSIDGIPGEATARAIRNFEVYNNYQVTGEVSAQMLDLLLEGGAAI